MTQALDAALDALRARAPEIPRLLRSLVEVNSYTENVAGVNAVGALLEQAFALPSLRLERRPGGDGRYGDHLIWRTPAASAPGAAPILLVGHHDTVFPPGHFEGWREEGGRAMGPGVLDMKGGLAIVQAALAALEAAGRLAGLPVVLVSVADEEIGSRDSARHLAEVARGCAAALVMESGRPGDVIVTRRRGTGVLNVAATGRAAHAGNAHKDGANAIWALARFIDAAQALTDYGRGRTVNVGVVRGGTSKNTVPEHAECVVDLRFDDVVDAHLLVEEVRAAAAAAAKAVPGTSLHADGGIRRPPLERTEASAALYAEYAACQRAAGLGDGEAPLVGGGSDGNNVAAVGVPVVDGLGARGAGYHTTGEYIELASLAPKAEALVRFLCGRL